MPEWKASIKRLADDFCLSQVKVNQMLKRVETTYSQRKIPDYYKGNQNNFLYDNAQRELMKLLYA